LVLLECFPEPLHANGKIIQQSRPRSFQYASFPVYPIVTCRGAWPLEGVWIGWISFFDTLHTPLWTTDNYSATANLCTLQFTVTHKLVSSVYYSLH
jgi:hypothetical protein